jgi:hypothetical protein
MQGGLMARGQTLAGFFYASATACYFSCSAAGSILITRAIGILLAVAKLFAAWVIDVIERLM